MTIINKVLLLQAIKGFQREKVSSNSRCHANKKVKWPSSRNSRNSRNRRFRTSRKSIKRFRTNHFGSHSVMVQLIIINKALLSQQMEGDQAIDITMYMICMPNNDYEHSVRKKENC